MTRGAQERSFGSLSREILEYAGQNLSRSEFLSKVSEAILWHAHADAVDMLLSEDGQRSCVEAAAAERKIPGPIRRDSEHVSITLACCQNDDGAPCKMAADGSLVCARAAVGSHATMVVANAAPCVDLPFNGGIAESRAIVHMGTETQSAVVAPFDVDAETSGVLALRSGQIEGFSRGSVELYAGIAGLVGMAVAHRAARHALDQSRRELFHADRLATIGTLASCLAHELNEPLTTVVGFAELMKKDGGMSDESQQDLGRITRASQHAKRIVQRLMSLARPAPPSWQRVVLRDVVETGLSFVEPRCASGHVRIELRFDPNLPELVADPTQLSQLVINLVLNAVQAMPSGGCLTLEAKSEPHGVVLVFADTGVGMDAETSARIFDPFFTTKSAAEGTGLGLAVVQRIVELHGGSIGVESARDTGTRFTLRLPLCPPGASELGPRPRRADE